MNNLENDLYLVKLVFKNKIHESIGSAFEDFAFKILQLEYPSLIKVKPDGNEGDWAADAICSEEGIYFQIYGPEYKDKNSNLSSAKSKIKKNSERVLKKWSESGLPVKEWYFVFNDRYSGAYPELFSEIERIKKENNLEKTGLFLTEQLENLVIKAYETKPQRIKLFLNNPVLELDEEALIKFNSIEPLYKICDFISKKHGTMRFEYLQNDPSIEDLEKLDKNKLNNKIRGLVLNSLDKTDLVKEFFESNNEFISEKIRDIVVRCYVRYAKKLDDKNQVFIKLLEDLWDNNLESNQDLKSALVILISYYFGICDIFEK